MERAGMAWTCSTRLASEACTIGIDRLAPTRLRVRIEGHDVGEFGALPFRCLEALMHEELPVELLVDARAARGASMGVGNDWAAWLGRSRHRFTAVHMLTGSKYVQVIAEFVRRFSELEGLMHVHVDPAAFDALLDRR
jgi:hypothetical protein